MRPLSSTQVAVIGGGYAGAWVAYRLAQRGVRTVLVSADDLLPPVSRKWSAGLIRRDVIEDAAPDETDMFADSSGVRDPHYPAMVAKYLPREFEELQRLVPYSPFGEFLRPGDPETIPGLGGGNDIVAAVLARFEELGGTRVQGRVTDMVLDGGACIGLRYQQDGTTGVLVCDDVVFASGGFAGLFTDGAGTSTGHLLGTYARHGGPLAHLEFFARSALGDLDRKLPCYPFDFNGPPRPLRAGAPADDLTRILAGHRAERFDFNLDMEIYQRYWTHHLHEPHTLELVSGVCRLGPIRTFGLGGIATEHAGTRLRNVHAVGECRLGPVLDAVHGLPLASCLAQGGMLADALAERPTAAGGGIGAADLATDAPQPGMEAALPGEISRRLDAVEGQGLRADSAEVFASWCREERGRRRDGGRFDQGDIDLLILAEAYIRSALARTESRGLFFRPDFPQPDPALTGTLTVAGYDTSEDRVTVRIVPLEDGSPS